MLCELAFEGQFNYAPFYCYIRLKEQEVRNMVWACETIVQKQKSKMNQHHVPIFSQSSPWRCVLPCALFPLPDNFKTNVFCFAK